MKLDFENVLNQYFSSKDNFDPEIVLKDITDNFKKAEESYLIGLNFYNNNLLDVAEKFFELSIKILEKLDKKLELSYLLHSIASLKASRNLIESKKLFQKALYIKEELKDNFGISLLLIDLANLEEISNNIEEAININKKCISYLIKENLVNDVFRRLIKLSDLDFNNSINYLAQALYISLNNTIDISDIIILISRFVKLLGLEDDNIPLIISTLSLIYKAKNLVNDETNKILMELISSCAFVRNIDNISKWIKNHKFDNIEFCLKKLEIFINNSIIENLISYEK